MLNAQGLKLASVGIALIMTGIFPGSALSAETSVAVASNFTAAAKEIAAAFEAETDHEASLSFGSTGQFYTQISQGAPFEVYLAADTARPAKALEAGFAVEGSDFTYAIGQIVLWSANPDRVKDAASLESGDFDKIAIANPETAPYGAAAVEVLKNLDLYSALEAKIVQGNNISQTYQFIETGNAELGFVALSQIAGMESGSRWNVPSDLYSPILQDAVLLKTGAENPAAAAFMEFLKGPSAAAIIEKYGYGVKSAN